jgi:hypothetical protein
LKAFHLTLVFYRTDFLNVPGKVLLEHHSRELLDVHKLLAMKSAAVAVNSVAVVTNIAMVTDTSAMKSDVDVLRFG